LTFSLFWSGPHGGFTSEGIDVHGAGGDLEDRLIVAAKHCVETVLRALDPDITPHEVYVNISGHAAEDSMTGTALTISIQVGEPQTPIQAPIAPEAPEGATPPSEAPTEAGDAPGSAVSSPADPGPDASPAEPSGVQATSPPDAAAPDPANPDG
jgi:hypothetical protein